MRVLLVLLLLVPGLARAQDLTVFAAASLTNALQNIGALWTKAGNGKVVFSFAASGTLAKQIEAGAPANLFASADEKWMDELSKKAGIAADTRKDFLGNSLVLVEPFATLKPVALTPGFDIAAILGPDGRLAVGDPAHVPAGAYAVQALKKLGVWPLVADHLAPADSVRSALLLVERGEAPAGVVFLTDVLVSPKLAVAGTFPAATHDPIRYPFAVTKTGDTPQARAFLAFLATPPAQAVFTKYGFTKP